MYCLVYMHFSITNIVINVFSNTLLLLTTLFYTAGSKTIIYAVIGSVVTTAIVIVVFVFVIIAIALMIRKRRRSDQFSFQRLTFKVQDDDDDDEVDKF